MEGFAGSTSEKFVLVAFARHASDQGQCWPSQQLIAHQVRLKRRQVVNLIASLLKSGWLKVERRGSGPGNSTRYRVVVPNKCATQCTFNGRSNVQSIAHLKSLPNVQSATANVQPIAHESVNRTVNRTVSRTVRGIPDGKRSRRKPQTSLPENFCPKPRHEAYAAKYDLSLEIEHEKFRSYHLGRDERWADWDRALDNWLIKAREFRGRNGRNPAPASAPTSTSDDYAKYLEGGQ